MWLRSEPHLPRDPGGRVWSRCKPLISLAAEALWGIQKPGRLELEEPFRGKPETGTKPISGRSQALLSVRVSTRPGCDWLLGLTRQPAGACTGTSPFRSHLYAVCSLKSSRKGRAQMKSAGSDEIHFASRRRHNRSQSQTSRKNVFLVSLRLRLRSGLRQYGCELMNTLTQPLFLIPLCGTRKRGWARPMPRLTALHSHT